MASKEVGSREMTVEDPASERRNDWLEKESSVAYKQESDGQTGRKTIGACGPKGMPPSRRQRAASVREAQLVLGKVTDARPPREDLRTHAPAQCPCWNSTHQGRSLRGRRVRGSGSGGLLVRERGAQSACKEETLSNFQACGHEFGADQRCTRVKKRSHDSYLNVR